MCYFMTEEQGKHFKQNGFLQTEKAIEPKRVWKFMRMKNGVVKSPYYESAWEINCMKTAPMAGFFASFNHCAVSFGIHAFLNKEDTINEMNQFQDDFDLVLAEMEIPEGAEFMVSMEKLNNMVGLPEIVSNKMTLIAIHE